MIWDKYTNPTPFPLSGNSKGAPKVRKSAWTCNDDTKLTCLPVNGEEAILGLSVQGRHNAY